MASGLVLRPTCDRCRSSPELYGSNCKHLTLCVPCGKAMAQNSKKCNFCGVVVTKLIREYNVRASTSTDKSLSIGKFSTGLPPFSKENGEKNKWTLHKEGSQGKDKRETLVLEDETGGSQYRGQQLDSARAANYYVLTKQGKEFVAVPARNWYNFNKASQYKQLTLEEAEEKMSRRRNKGIEYERWMMKGKSNDKETQFGKGEEHVEQKEACKNRLASNKKSIDCSDDDDNDVEATLKSIYDLEDDGIEKGDDWEHEENFTDDDEAVGNDPEEREDWADEKPAPPEIKQDGSDDEELNKSGKELKRLLGRAAGSDESDAMDIDDDNDDITLVLKPKQNHANKDEPAKTSPPNPLPSGSAQNVPTTKSSKGKRKAGSGSIKSPNGAPAKQIKTENEATLASIKDEPPSSFKSNVPPKELETASPGTGLSPSVAPVTADELRAVLRAKPLTIQDVVALFKGRLKSQEEKTAFADILKKISRKQIMNGCSYIVLKDR